MRTRDNDESFDRNVKIVSQVNEFFHHWFLTLSSFSMIKMKSVDYKYQPDPNIYYNRRPLQRVVIKIFFKFRDN